MAGNLRACEEGGQGVSPPVTFGKGSPALTVGTAPGWLLFQLQWGSSNLSFQGSESGNIFHLGESQGTSQSHLSLTCLHYVDSLSIKASSSVPECILFLHEILTQNANEGRSYRNNLNPLTRAKKTNVSKSKLFVTNVSTDTTSTLGNG